MCCFRVNSVSLETLPGALSRALREYNCLWVMTPHTHTLFSHFLMKIGVHYGIGRHLIQAVKTDAAPPEKLVNLFKV